MTVYLDETSNPIDPEERVKINLNWRRIMGAFVNLQRQINILAGGQEVDELLARIDEAINNAINTTTNTQQVLDDISAALNQLEPVLNDALVATNKANDAADDANVLNVALTALKADLERLQIDLQPIVDSEVQRVTNEQARVNAETSRSDAEAVRVNAETLRITAEQARIAAHNELLDLLTNFKSLPYDASVTYDFPTIISYNGSSYIVLKGVTGIAPINDGINYRLLAQKGVDGTGAVSTVNNVAPDSTGNVNLTSASIGAASTSDLTTTNDNLEALDGIVTTHLADITNVKSYGAVGDGATDDTDAIQQALNQGGLILIPSGTYLITTTLRVPSNTILLGTGNSILKRNASILAILINDSDGTQGLYNANENILIENLTFDSNGTNFSTNVSTLAFGHMRGLTLRNVKILNTFGWHCLELNSSQHTLIEGCTFDDLNAGTGNEMLQIDLAYSSGVFPWFGPWDNTPCEDVTIRNCVFKNGVCGIGSHSAQDGYKHKVINIYDNHFSNLTEECVKPYNWDVVEIEDNYMLGGTYGIYISNPFLCYNYSIANNHIESPTIRGIHIALNATDVKILKNNVNNATNHGITFNGQLDIIVDGNKVKNCGQAGIWSYGSEQVKIINNYSVDNDKTVTGIRQDIMIGYGTNVAKTTIVKNNTMGTLAYGKADSIIIKDNFIGSVTVGADNTNIQISENFINNTWVI
ncbi:glycosyl hydrolase family 28-related protein [Lysinibacillus sp. LZ02]|uniref:glycosyl hydrolase family 28-related protein n=1 Tax=Lysinibacillus sp. LZ02 TaxID=3420668 RepID=UPI003D3674A6